MISLSSSGKAIKQLEELMTQAADSYYNKGKFLNINISKEYPALFKLLDAEFHMPKTRMKIDDETFDELTAELKRLNPKSKVLKQIGAPVQAGKGKAPKVKLKHYMGSLDKIKPATAVQWLMDHEGPYVVSNKEDGVSIQLNYLPKQVAKAFTRGDGMKGQDISHLVPHLDIPQTLKIAIDIRGEIIMPEATFKAKWSTEKLGKKEGFENARNMVAGMANRKDVHPAVKDVHVVVYEVLTPRGKPSDQLKLLKKLGFNVVPYKVYKDLTPEQLSKILKVRKKKTKRAIDGLVVVLDKKVPLAEGSNPDHAVAYKETAAEDIVEVKVKQVVWEESRHGTLKPRVEIEPVRLAGVTVTFATGHNAYFIEHGYRYKDRTKGMPVMPIGPGAKILITRSGDVIPHIVQVLKAAKTPQMPEVEYTYGKNKVEIKQSVKTDLNKVKRITYFFTKLGVDGVKQGMIQKLYDAGLDNIFKIAKAKKSKFLAIEGIQDKTASKMRDNMDAALKNATLPALMEASGKFGQGLGEKRLVPLVKAFPKLMTGKYSQKQLTDMAMGIEGFSNVLSKQFAERFPAFKEFYDKLGIEAKMPEEKKKAKAKGDAFSGQTIVFTGFRDPEWAAKVEEQGGTMGEGVKKDTSLLVFNDPQKSFAKIEKAKKMGVATMQRGEFAKRIEKL
jgi:NAD-dependent DNA ligase